MKFRCIACQWSRAELLGNRGGYDVFRCPECCSMWRTPILGHVRMAPELPREGEKYLGGWYHDDFCVANGIPTFDEQFERDMVASACRVKALKKVLPVQHGAGIQTLDMGTGNGAFVLQALAVGYDAFGMEAGQDLINRQRNAHRALKTRLTLGSEPTKFPGGWHAITYHDVLEHVPDPYAQVRLAARWINPGGILVIEAPDPACSEALDKLLDFRHLKPFEHTMLLAAPIWMAMMDAAGFEHIQLTAPIPTKLSVYGRRRKG